MIKSLSRLVRQVFVGARAHPTSEAIMGAGGRPAHDAAMRHEDLKRAMEIAFAAPASPLEPGSGVVVEMATGHEAAAEICPQTSRAEEEVIASVDEAILSWDDTVEPVEEAVAAVAETADEVAEEPLEEVLVDVEAASVPEAADEPVAVADASLEDAVAAPSDELVAEDVAGEEVVVEADAATDDAAVEGALAAAPAKRTRAKKAAAKKKAAPRKKGVSNKASAPKAAAELPEDAVWISDAVSYTLSGAWSSAWSPPEDSTGVERLEEFHAKAAEGALAVWGRVEGADEWAPIKASTWKSAVVEPRSFLMGRENVTTEAKSAKSKAKTYSALKVSKARVEELWPVAAGDEVRDAA